MNSVETISTCSSSIIDELEPYTNTRVILNVGWTDRPIFGKLIRYDSRFLVLEKKDGRFQTIRRKAVLSIDVQREVV